MKIEAEIFRIAEKTPKQDEFVMVIRQGDGYWTPKVYNEYYNCWDTADGDDYECDVDENDIWLRLPNKDVSSLFAEKIQ
jgi:hypothetical protein